MSLDIHQRRFLKHTDQLFENDINDVQCLRVLHEGGFSGEYAKTWESLKQTIEDNKERVKEAFYIIRQYNTLSRLLISQAGLQLIIDSYNLSTRFLNVVTSFGHRRDDEHRAWDGYYISPANAEVTDESELSYVVRYVENHGRTNSNPWSVRQVGVCQRTIDVSGSEESVWVILQPSNQVYEGLEDALKSRTQNASAFATHPCALHLNILESVASSWGDYVEWSWAEVDKLDDKACLLEMGYDKPHDYEVNFKDCQRVQRLRRKLFRAISVLESNKALADGIAARFPGLFTIRIANYKAEIDSRQKSLLQMVEHLKGTSELLFNILNTRNDKLMRDGSQSMEKSLDLMGEIAEQGRNDSSTLKLLSMIATIYLPASLIATIFSSNLIELKTNDNGLDTFHVVSQFWLYIAVTIALTVLTFICGVFVLRRKILKDLHRYRSRLESGVAARRNKEEV